MDNRVCRVCGKLYKSVSALNRHTLSAHSSHTYKCKYCPTEYKRTDNLNKHIAIKHGDMSALYNNNNWSGLANHKACDTTELSKITSQDRASSPITIMEGLPTLCTQAREINPPCQNNTPIEGKVLTGRSDRFIPKERRWTMQLQAHNPCPTPTIDKEKIKMILNKSSKKPVAVDPSQQLTSVDPLNLKRLPTRPMLYNPPAKKPKFRICNPVRPTPHVKVLLPNEVCPSAQPGPSRLEDQSSKNTQGEPKSPPPKQDIPSRPATPKRSCQSTLDKFVKRLRPTNVYKPALLQVQRELKEVDQLIHKFGVVEQDLQLSESSEDEDDDCDLRAAASALEDAVLNMD